MNTGAFDESEVAGEFIDLNGERFYAIRNVQKMPPFFISVVSNLDHWLFISSTGGLTAGRGSPETPLFPYVTVDKIYDSIAHTGCKTILHLRSNGERNDWEPFNIEHDGRYKIRRHLYKNLLGNKLCFEEVNRDLDMVFRYCWLTSDRFGFVRRCELENTGSRKIGVDMIDGLQNILPAGTPGFTQANSSNLVDAYKWTELLPSTGLALFTLYSGITDRAEPCESLRANTVFSLGLDQPNVLISSEQLEAFRIGANVDQEVHKRGIRGGYLVNSRMTLNPNEVRRWQIVADVERSQNEIVALNQQLTQPETVAEAIDESVQRGSDELARIMAASDAFQLTAEENVSVHHYANVLFNVLRGGIFYDQYKVSRHDFIATLNTFNRRVAERQRDLLDALPATLEYPELLAIVRDSGDDQLQRLCREYLPITFGRRHGDPSRPWNKFAIRMTDEHGYRLLSYEGNWRDIFQNWEALALSYPEFAENMIAKFVNASTIDGYNPYRINKEGIDWEVEDPDNPWSYIGYWGDHQIIYLQKLLEISRNYHPDRLSRMLRAKLFCYANVPYRIRSFDALLNNPKETVDYDDSLSARIEQRVAEIGADGKLILDNDGNVYQVNLLEKLLVPLLAKLGNLVIEGGIWLNTQRPEWNDANNALVGQGLSMVTLYYMRRYVAFLARLLEPERDAFELSQEVSAWFDETAAILATAKSRLSRERLDAKDRFAILQKLGRSAGRYREKLYRAGCFAGTDTKPVDTILTMLDNAQTAIDYSIGHNRRDDGMFHAYNTLSIDDDKLEVNTLFTMLEGQVAALSSGAVSPEDCVSAIEALFASKVYRENQNSFMLYPDRPLPRFLEKNRVPKDAIESIPLLVRMFEHDDHRLVLRDAEGTYRFNANITNVGDLRDRLRPIADEYAVDSDTVGRQLMKLHEAVFNHQAFTGRSGGMFGFEGLGCIYWHMVAKLLLAVQENFFAAGDTATDPEITRQLGELYYRIRAGLGFNQKPDEYGAFPTDPYSHTPKHSGAQQPGMTGQVKEEILSRFGELGVRVCNGAVAFQPRLLRRREFTGSKKSFRYLDVHGSWQDIPIPKNALAFTCCQVPIVYQLDKANAHSLAVTLNDNRTKSQSQLELSVEDSAALFQRTGEIRSIHVDIDSNELFSI